MYLNAQRQVWLVLVANADHLGVVTRAPVTTLQDYSQLDRRAVEALLTTFESDGWLKRLHADGKRGHYHLLGPWKKDIPDAQRYIAQEGERVRSLQNRRARVAERNQPESAPPNKPASVRIVNMELVSSEHPLKYRFNVQVPGIGSIFDMALIERVDGSVFIAEPRKKINGEWIKTLDLYESLRADVTSAALEMARKLGYPLPKTLR